MKIRIPREVDFREIKEMIGDSREGKEDHNLSGEKEIGIVQHVTSTTMPEIRLVIAAKFQNQAQLRRHLQYQVVEAPLAFNQ